MSRPERSRGLIPRPKTRPYMQIGESKYGKPILERVVTPEMELLQATKCAIVSIDSTVRSNVAVALSIDMMVMNAEWGEGLGNLFNDLPAPA